MRAKNIDFRSRNNTAGVHSFVEREPDSRESSVELLELEVGARHPPAGHIVNPNGETLIVHQSGTGFVRLADNSSVTLLSGKVVRVPHGTPFAVSTCRDSHLWVLAVSFPTQEYGYLHQS